MIIGNVLPHLGAFGGVRRFLELGNIFVNRGIDFTIFSASDLKCEWFDFRGKIRDWSKIKADYVIIGDTPSLRVAPRVQGKVFVYVIVGGDYGKDYKKVYGRYPFIVNNRIFRKQFPKAHLAEGGVNTHFFRPPKKKRKVSSRVRVLYYAAKRKFKGREYIKAALSGIDGIELIGLSGLNNKQLLEAYHSGDFAVTWESRPGWSNLASEAIASGLTVVTNGMNCEPFIDRVIKVSDLREFFSNPENRKIRKPGSMEEFSWEKVADRLLQIFKHHSHHK